MSKINAHDGTKDAQRLGSATTDSDRTFKKSHQTVDRPITTDHDIHEEYLRDPPQNVPIDIPVTNSNAPGRKEGAWERESDEIGVGGQEGMGRPKKSDIQGELLNENSVHP